MGREKRPGGQTKITKKRPAQYWRTLKRKVTKKKDIVVTEAPHISKQRGEGGGKFVGQ